MSTKFQRTDHQTVIDLYTQNYAKTEIEEKMRISWGLIKKILTYNNIPIVKDHRKFIRDEIDANYLIERYKGQRNLRTLSKEFNASITLLTNILKSHGIEIKERIVNEKEVIDKFNEYNDIKKTGSELNVSDYSVTKILKKYDIKFGVLQRVHIGDKFGMLTVIGIANPRVSKSGLETKRFQCECECGGKVISIGVKLNSGKIWNCGCIWNKKRESVLMEKKRKQELRQDKIEEEAIKKNEKLLEKEKKREVYNQKKKEWEINVGDKFHRWKVIEIIIDNGKKYLCECECGTTRFFYTAQSLKISRSCGCLQREKSTTSGGIYSGKENQLMYARYKSMKRRCYNPTNENYKNYGGIGIKVCDRWLEPDGQGYKNFCNDMGSRPSDKHSLDRINPFGDYGPDNCRWATASVQSANKRRHFKDNVLNDTYEISSKVKMGN